MHLCMYIRITKLLSESICFAYEKLQKDQQEMGLTKDRQLDLVWLRESNEKLRKDVLKVRPYWYENYITYLFVAYIRFTFT
jgi:hypothetical protein